MSSLWSNISSLSAGGDSFLLDPADALRTAAVISSIVEHAPGPESAAELMEVIELKVCDVSTASVATFSRRRRKSGLDSVSRRTLYSVFVFSA